MSTFSDGDIDFNHALASLLAELRTAHLTSQGTLGSELGIDQATVSRVESGQRRLSIAEAFAWFEALGITLEDTTKLLGDLWRQHGGRAPGFWENT